MLLGLQSNIAALEKDVKALKEKLSAARKVSKALMTACRVALIHASSQLIKEQDRRIKAGPSDEQSAQAAVSAPSKFTPGALLTRAASVYLGCSRRASC